MKKQKIVAIIQVRIGSSRLPGKVLIPIVGKPMLWHIVNRVEKAKFIDQVVVATSVEKNDDKIARFCKKNNIEVFRGSENDVLDRYYECAKKYKADIVVRITADCPLIDPKIIGKSIKSYLKGNFDYIGVLTGAGSFKSKDKKYPDGMDCEVFAFQSLKKACREATSNKEREHVTVYILRNPNSFKIGKLESSKDYSNIRLTVDHKEDLELVRKIYKELYPINKFFGLSDIIGLIKRQPGLLKINQKYIGREGYEKLWKKKAV